MTTAMSQPDDKNPFVANPASPASRAAVLSEVRTVFLDRVERAVRAAGVDTPASVAALRDGAILLLDQMTTAGARTGFALANSLTASQIRLVDDNQLELSIRLGDISKRLRDECSSFLYKFHQRFVTLLDKPSLRLTDNPLSPEAICRALADMFGAADGVHAQALLHLADIETHLVRELPLLYSDLNEILVRHNVTAAKIQSSNSSEHPIGNRRKRPGIDGDADAMAALQQAVLARLPAVAAMTAQAGAAMTAALPRFEQIMAQIDEWQDQALNEDLFGDTGTAPAENCLHDLKATETMTRLRAQDAVALDVLAVLFDALFEDARLSPVIKAAVARLQLPVLKAAILDTTFFTEPDHPARALLESMAEATIGIGAEADADHPVCIELQRVATGVQKEFQRDTEVFVRYGTELESFMARRNHELQGGAQAYIALAKAQEAQDLAARAAWRLVVSRTVSVTSRVVADFLREHWTKVLAKDWLESGANGDAWRYDERVLDDLLWSIEPKADTEERRQLGQLVPNLLGRIKTGLDRVAVPAEARSSFMDACFALQAAAIRGRTTQPLLSPASAAGALDHDSLVPITADGVTLMSVRPHNPDERVSGDVVRELVIGDWVEFRMPDNTMRCGRLCWISAELGTPLFMNSSWDCAISIARSSLERQFSEGVAATGSQLSFFDKAIDQAISQSQPGKL